MATGQTIASFSSHDYHGPLGGVASPDLDTNDPLVDMVASDAWYSNFVVPSGYGGGGFDVFIIWSMASATTGDVKWGTSFAKKTSRGAPTFATAITGTTTVNGTAALFDTETNVHTDGASIDSVAVGDNVQIKLTRDTVAGDATGDAELYWVLILES